MKLASDLDNNEYVGAVDPNSLLHVQFYSRPVLQPFLSEQEKRPIYKDLDFVKIHTPGNQLNIIDVPVDEGHKAQFPREWARYQNGKGSDENPIGTPLAQWPQLRRSQVEELRALKFFSVEQIAGASDEAIMKIGMCGGKSPMGLREDAKKFLHVAKGAAESAKFDDELKKRDDEINALKKQMEELLAAQSGKGSNTLSLKK